MPLNNLCLYWQKVISLTKVWDEPMSAVAT